MVFNCFVINHFAQLWKEWQGDWKMCVQAGRLQCWTSYLCFLTYHFNSNSVMSYHIHFRLNQFNWLICWLSAEIWTSSQWVANFSSVSTTAFSNFLCSPTFKQRVHDLEFAAAHQICTTYYGLLKCLHKFPYENT